MVARSAAAQLPAALFRLALAQYGFGSSQKPRQAPCRDLALERLHLRQPITLFLEGNVVGLRERGRARPRRILERVDGVVLRLAEQAEGVREIGLGLTREAHDDVGGDRNIRAALAQVA